MTKSSREVFYELSQQYTDEELIKKFLEQCKSYLENRFELKLPIQLVEDIFNFDFHRDDTIKHPIGTRITNYFKDEGMRILKIRGKYSVKIQKRE